VKAQLTIGRKLFSAVGVLAILMVALGATAVVGTSNVNSLLDESINSTARKLELVLKFQTTLAELRGLQRRELLALFVHDESLYKTTKQSVDNTMARGTALVQEIEPLLVSEAGKSRLAEIRAGAQEWRALNTQVEVLLDDGKLTEAWAFGRASTNAALDRADKAAAELAELELGLLTKARTTAESTFTAALSLIGGVVLLTLVALGAVVLVVQKVNSTLRQTTDELKNSALHVAAASSQIATSAQALSQGATEQAASLEESSASLEEMASMTRLSADNADQAAVMMANMNQRVTDAHQMLEDMVQSMDGIRDSSMKVAKIIKTIDDIAFQTNILALNAAVEAARAGDAGMGFAVVAGEVRNLAQRSSEASKNTAVLIEEAGSNAEKGSGKVAQVAAAINEFTGTVAAVKGIAEQASTASRQESQGIEQVAQAVSQMEKVTQTTAAAAEESAAASEELNAQADHTLNVVIALERMVGGREQATAPAGASRPGGKTGKAKVVTFAQPGPSAAPSSKPVAKAQRAEEAVPFQETGTFGKF
jgi:methyl-accepting chemotaxis protein